MLRKHENTDSWKAGFLAIAVHVLLLGAMLVSFNWKAAHPVLNITEVELWDKLPAAKPVVQPAPDPQPKLVVEEKPKPLESKPIVEEKLKPDEPKVDIALENKKKELELKEKAELEKLKFEKLELQKKVDQTKKLAEEMREDALKDAKAAEKQAKLDRQKELSKLQQELLNENAGANTKAASAANAGVIDTYTEKIKIKIRGNINNTLCGDGNPVLKVNIGILPTGQLKGDIKITKSSGNQVCDNAVERAILMSEPFQLPDDAKLKAEFRELFLTIKPND